MRKDIFELSKFAKDKGIRTALSTNGILITEEVAKRIRRAGFSYVGISLDGAKEVNDAFRHSQGAFNASVRAIRNCRKVGLKVGLRFTMTKYNVEDLSRIFDLVERESLPRFSIYPFSNLRDESNLQGKCWICELKTVCGGCRARAYAATGNYLEEDTKCAYQLLTERF